ncbi:hypothetical protein NQ317_015476, partial [Molorchus minor]
VQGNDFDYSRNDPSPPVRGIDCDYSRNDPSTPDFSRTLPKPKTTVRGIDCDYSRNDRALPIFPELSRSLKPPCLVRGIDCDYSRNDPSTPDFSRTLPKARNTVFGVFHHIFRCEESIAAIPETIRALPTFPEFSRSLKPSYEESTVPEAIRELPNMATATIFPKSSNE